MTFETNKIINTENFSVPEFKNINDNTKIWDRLSNLWDWIKSNLDKTYSKNLKSLFSINCEYDTKFDENKEEINNIFAQFLSPQNKLETV